MHRQSVIALSLAIGGIVVIGVALFAADFLGYLMIALFVGAFVASFAAVILGYRARKDVFGNETGHARTIATVAVFLGALVTLGCPLLFLVFIIGSANIGHGRPLLIGGRLRVARCRRDDAWSRVDGYDAPGAPPGDTIRQQLTRGGQDVRGLGVGRALSIERVGQASH